MTLDKNIAVIGTCGSLYLLANHKNGVTTTKSKCVVIDYNPDYNAKEITCQTYDAIEQPIKFNGFQFYSENQIENATLLLIQCLPDNIIEQLNNFLK